uniref:Aminopeptidase n=1 Tax=Glossina brevipalpis TaxID=37001 RepID=A0A1A9WJU0_9MUSC
MLQLCAGVMVQVLLIATFFCCSLSVAPKSHFRNYTHYRLPESIRPEHYTLKVVTLLDPLHLTFAGEVIIKFRVLIGTGNITLHARNLTIDEDRIELQKHEYTKTTLYAIDAVRSMDLYDYYVIHTCLPLLRDETYTLKLVFRAPLNHLLHGYYRSSYVDQLTNEIKWLSVTQFEPAYARIAFPCFDEPNYRTKFKVWLGHHKSFDALSNAPLHKQEQMSSESNETTDYVWSIFHETVPIPTYLVAYSVNNFTYKLSGNYGVKFSTWCRPEIADQCELAAQLAPELFTFFESILKSPLYFSKIDQVFIPDFAANAMENWGLITYRENALLFSTNISSEMNRRRVTTVVAHEVAHQWFGNLVNVKWWSNVWIIEGFATYMSILGVHHLNPGWNFLGVDSMNNILGVFESDARINSHPLTQEIKSIDQINNRFITGLSYKKGAMLLRMVHMIVGDDVFVSSIREYFSKSAYTADDYSSLWNTLTIKARSYQRMDRKVNLNTIIGSWGLQTGYPLLRVTRNYRTNNAYITQERFLLNSSHASIAPKNCWWIPITFTNASRLDFYGFKPSHWLECNGNERINITLKSVAARNDWVIFNVQIMGLYRVMYDKNNWILLNRTLNSKNYTDIHVLNRAQLIEDSLTLAWAGHIHYNLTLDILNYLQYEENYLPWRTALRGITKLDNVLKSYTETYKIFTDFVGYLLLPTYNSMQGLNITEDENETTHIAIMHRTQITYWACHVEIDDCVQAAKKYFNDWKASNVNKIPVNLRLAVYCTAIKYGDQSDWEFLWQYLQGLKVPSEQRTVIQSLCCSRNGTILSNFLHLIFNDTKYIRRQDSAAAFEGITRNQVGFQLAKDYLDGHVDELYEYYGTISRDITKLILPLARQITKTEDNKALLDLLNRKRDMFGKLRRSVLNAVEVIQLNVDWIKRYRNIVHKKLSKQILNPVPN